MVVWVDENGNTLSSAGGMTPPTPAPQPAAPVIQPAPVAPAPAPVPKPARVPQPAAPAAAPAAPVNIKSNPSAAVASKGDWAQVAYYNSEEQSSHGLAFLGNYGGTHGSGVYDRSVSRSIPYLKLVNSNLGFLETRYLTFLEMDPPALRHQSYSLAN
jgi:hypothetical protein